MMQARALSLAGLLLVTAAITLVLVVSGSEYVLHARFADATGLVPGGHVQLAGRTVGSISKITLTPDGQADVALSISSGEVTPLHVGTRAYVRAVGQAGVDNRYIDLAPGPVSEPTLPDGSVLPTSQTSGLVPIDALLDAFGPAQRTDVETLITSINGVYAGSGSRSFNEMLARLDPALGSLEGFTGSLALDRDALGQLVRAGSAAAHAVASRQADLTSGVTYTAQALGAVARQHDALADTLTRLPAVLAQGRHTLVVTGQALDALRPTLRDVLPAAGPLNSFLGHLNRLMPSSAPVIGSLTAQLPGLNRSLNGLAPVAPGLTNMLRTFGPAMKGLLPIARGVRYYGTDLVLGTLAALFGTLAGEYNSSGHFIKVNFVQSPQTLVGPLASVLAAHPLVPGILAERTGLLRRCPGGNQPPAPDGSNPWDLGASFCTASQDEPLSVDFP